MAPCGWNWGSTAINLHASWWSGPSKLIALGVSRYHTFCKKKHSYCKKRIIHPQLFCSLFLSKADRGTWYQVTDRSLASRFMTYCYENTLIKWDDKWITNPSINQSIYLSITELINKQFNRLPKIQFYRAGRRWKQHVRRLHVAVQHALWSADRTRQYMNGDGSRNCAKILATFALQTDLWIVENSGTVVRTSSSSPSHRHRHHNRHHHHRHLMITFTYALSLLVLPFAANLIANGLASREHKQPTQAHFNVSFYFVGVQYIVWLDWLNF